LRLPSGAAMFNGQKNWEFDRISPKTQTITDSETAKIQDGDADQYVYTWFIDAHMSDIYKQVKHIAPMSPWIGLRMSKENIAGRFAPSLYVISEIYCSAVVCIPDLRMGWHFLELGVHG
jgi:hypothetical protein